MNKLLKRIEDLMVAVTFAEAAEYDEAQRIAGVADEEQNGSEMTRDLHGKMLTGRAAGR